MAVLIQLCLLQDRKDLAQATYNSAKKIGNDSMLVQALEAWIGMKTVCLSRATGKRADRVGLATAAPGLLLL